MATLVVILPILLILTVDTGNLKRTLKLTPIVVAVLLPVSAYVGWQTEPQPAVEFPSILAGFIVSMVIASFKGLMYLQQLANREKLTYEILFTYSWRNFLTTGLGGAFIGSAALILVLWASLFSVIGVTFFTDLFTKPWFICMTLALSFGMGVIMFRNLTTVIDSITALLEGLLRLLLPLIISVSAIFLATLPIVGLSPLWDTGNGTALLLALTAVILFCVNAVYQSGANPVRYAAPIQWLIACGLLTLPVLCVLSFHGLWLRIDQYGWSVERCWAMVIWLVLASFSTGYSIGIVRHRIEWPGTLARVNTYMGLGILALMILVNSPLLDFRKISLASQLARVEASDSDWSGFDFLYAKRHLGRPGYLLSQSLLSGVAADDEVLTRMIENPYSIAQAQQVSLNLDNIIRRPADLTIPPELEQMLKVQLIHPDQIRFVLVRVNLTRDGKDNYALMGYGENFQSSATLYYQNTGGQWLHRYLLQQRSIATVVTNAGSGVAGNVIINTSMGDVGDSKVQQEQLLQGEIQATEPEFKALKIGDLVFEVR
jgi:hypothetical protein